MDAGAIFIASACVAWGVGNNLTRKLSSSDPVQNAMAKGLAAGGVKGVDDNAFSQRMEVDYVRVFTPSPGS